MDGGENEDGIHTQGSGVALRRVRSDLGDGSGLSGLQFARRAKRCWAGFTRGRGNPGGGIVVRVQGGMRGPARCREVRRAVSGLGKPRGLFPSNMAALCLRLVQGAGCPVPGVYILDIPLASYL